MLLRSQRYPATPRRSNRAEVVPSTTAGVVRPLSIWRPLLPPLAVLAAALVWALLP